jgi:hypothetical protein
MSFGSPRTGPNPRLKRGLKKKLSIGQQSWTKGRRKASRLSNNCHARGRANEPPQTPYLGTPTSLPTKLWRGPEPAPLSVEPLSAAVDLLLKRAVPTLRFYIRKPRFPQAGFSLL